MQELLQYTVPNTLPEVGEFIDTIRNEVFYAQLSQRCQYLLALILEELMTNIVKYGYDDQEPHEISVKISRGDNVLQVTVMDDGHPFDPLCDARQPQIDAALEDRGIGGIGIHLVQTMAKDICYKRVKNHNVLTVTLDEGQ